MFFEGTQVSLVVVSTWTENVWEGSPKFNETVKKLLFLSKFKFIEPEDDISIE